VKTFTNTAFGFTLAYPASWNVDSWQDPHGTAICFADPKRLAGASRCALLFIYPHWSLQQDIAALNREAIKFNLPDNQVSMSDVNDIRVGAYAAKRFTYAEGHGGSPDRILIQRGTTAFIFDFWTPDLLFESVVSSLRFLHP